ncbi:putative ATP-binding protein involved in virulence [Chromohalobacter marismortui]|uniref:Putative ATP-binding protein involved in virulence n=1 Tax=Chromohalobacter marismortui TaxID=42055 RepID=A0A4R7NFE5_9GAMM|nr:MULTISPECIES: AAA family ATPase [Chromohalobacter]MCI0510985.1 AAA family ATPase [Chromohalobacter sp.]MCI0593261.1 AAA family ATPase [Chromohalobacter sp.]TDU19223.1 putative ATP-binding protein involved in virulence [Chromohalobacter marismortui]
MKLKRLTLENFRAKPSLSVTLGPRLTLLMGANGTGKTTLLDGIAIGLGEILSYLPSVAGMTFKKRGDLHQRGNHFAPYTRITLETFQRLSWDRLQRRDNSKKTAGEIPPGQGVKALKQHLDSTVINPWAAGEPFELPVFAYYGVSRALLDLPLSRKGFPKSHERFDALANALNADTRFKSAFVWFYNKENEEHRLQKQHKSFDVTLPELDAVRRAITQLFPDLSEPHIELNPLRFAVKQQGEWLNIAQLSDGYQTLLGVVIDLSSRMAMANPHLDDPLAAEAVVMIDEIDLHLHPEWQRRVVGDLLVTFPNAQFIATTHSPFIVEALNNHLKRSQLDGLEITSEVIQALPPLSPEEVAAYHVTPDEAQSLMDTDLGLLDDKLLSHFNAINRLYDEMRDLEWEHRGA